MGYRSGGNRNNYGRGRRSGGRNSRSKNWQKRSRGGRGRDPKEASQSGNKRERIAIESGSLVFLDQFMLANPQFVDLIRKNIDAEPEKKQDIIKDYGGCVVSLNSGTYKIERDPFALSIVVHPESVRVDIEEASARAENSIGRVFVDTRCLAMIDRELLDDEELLIKYQDLWFKGEEKACRDLIRDNGGAVRYGFQRYGDELGIYRIPGEDVICLWPDVAEPELEQEVKEETVQEEQPPEAATESAEGSP